MIWWALTKAGNTLPGFSRAPLFANFFMFLNHCNEIFLKTVKCISNMPLHMSVKKTQKTQKSLSKVSSEFHPLWAVTGRIWFLTVSWVNLCILKLLCALKQHRCSVTWWMNSGGDRKVWHLSGTMSSAMSKRSAVGKLLEYPYQYEGVNIIAFQSTKTSHWEDSFRIIQP